MGVAGAGWATIISQFVSFCLLLHGCSKGSNIHIHIRNVQLKWHYFKMIIRGGLPSLARQSLASVATICLNHAAQPYGDAAIAAMGVVQRITMFGFSTMLGFGQGFQPVCGFNYGAGLYSRVKAGFWFCVKISFGFLVGVCVLGYIFAPNLIALFRDDPAVIEFGTRALRFQCLTLWVQSWVVMSNMLMQSIGRAVPATFLAVARQGLFFIPAVLLLPPILGALGIQMAQSAADLVTFLLAIPIQLRVLRSLGADKPRR
jgi:Na+-driven multidrug efflux pump